MRRGGLDRRAGNDARKLTKKSFVSPDFRSSRGLNAGWRIDRRGSPLLQHAKRAGLQPAACGSAYRAPSRPVPCRRAGRGTRGRKARSCRPGRARSRRGGGCVRRRSGRASRCCVRMSPRPSTPFSTKSACAAPREIASMPSAPVPAKRSSTRVSALRQAVGMREDVEERLAQAVARRADGVAARRRRAARPLSRPPTMRMRIVLAAALAARAPSLRGARRAVRGLRIGASKSAPAAFASFSPSWSRSTRAAHLLDLARRQVAELERPVGDADQAVHREPEMLEHALDLAVLAFAQAEREPDVDALHAIERRLDRAVDDAVDRRRRRRSASSCAWSIVAVGAHAVAAQPAGRRQLQHAREAAVVGEEQQALGVDVEPADRDDARQVFGQGVEDGRRGPPGRGWW